MLRAMLGIFQQSGVSRLYKAHSG